MGAVVLVVLVTVGIAIGVRGSDGAIAAGSATTVASTEPSTTTSTTAPARMSDAELVEAHASAVWKVEFEGCGLSGYGSAWAVDEHHLVTNAHVVREDPTPRLRSRTGRGMDAVVVGLNDELDIAVIEVAVELDHSLDWASTASLSEGQRVLGLGYPVPGDFAAAPGTIVSFLSEDGTRAAVRTDAALDRGNSGGPLLTEEGEVAGVVTLVIAEGIQAVPHAFTADHLRSAVGQMIASPRMVSETCEAVEVEPAPEADVPEYEAPPAPDVPTYTPPPTTTLPCPAGRPTVTVDNVSTVQESPEYIPEWWSVTVKGTVRNDTDANIYVGMIDIQLAGVPGSHTAFPDAYELRPGEASPFTADLYIESQSQPGGATANMTGWSWSDFDLYGCGTA